MPSTDPPADRARPPFAYLLGAGALFLALWGLFRVAESIKPIFFLVAMAIVLAAALHGPITFLERWLPRPLAALIVCLGLVGAGVAAFFVAYPVLVAQVRNLVVVAPIGMHRIEGWIQRESAALGQPAILDALKVRVGREIGDLAAAAPPAVVAIGGTLGTALVLLVLALYLGYDAKPYLRGIVRLVPPAREATVVELFRRLGLMLQAWIRGTLISMSAVGLATALGLWIAGLDAWLLLGLLAFVGEFVPFLGPVVSGTVATAMGLAVSPSKALEVGLICLGIQQLEGQVLVPLVMRRAVKVQPAMLIVWQLAVGRAFGLLALLVATPLIAAIQVGIEYLYVERTLGKPVPPADAPGAGGA